MRVDVRIAQEYPFFDLFGLPRGSRILYQDRQTFEAVRHLLRAQFVSYRTRLMASISRIITDLELPDFQAFTAADSTKSSAKKKRTQVLLTRWTNWRINDRESGPAFISPKNTVVSGLCSWTLPFCAARKAASPSRCL